MADHRFVELVIDWLESNWNSSNYPGGYDGAVPAIVDKDDGESQEFAGREVAYDLSDNNAVIVGSSPDRTQDPIGTEFDYAFEDGVSVKVVAAHESEVAYPGEDSSPGVSGSDEFRALYQEVRRILHDDRVWPDRNQSAASTPIRSSFPIETNLSSQYQNLYEYDITALVRGHEEL